MERVHELCSFYYSDAGLKHALDVAMRTPDRYKKVALCHDLIEDTDVSYEELFEVLSADEMRSLLRVTRHPHIPYLDYIRRIKKSYDECAIAVKIADLEDHLEKVETLKPTLKKRYEAALDILKEKNEDE